MVRSLGEDREGKEGNQGPGEVQEGTEEVKEGEGEDEREEGGRVGQIASGRGLSLVF